MILSQPPFRFNVSELINKARHYVNKRVDGVTINLPFISFSVQPDDLEQKIARETIIRLADKRVLNASECCDNCIEQAIVSLQEIRSMLVEKQVELAGQVDGGLYLLLELMLEGIRQFFSFEERLRIANTHTYGEIHTRHDRNDLQPYFSALEMLRGHLYRCLTQVATIAKMKIPKIPENMRYMDAWQIDSYEKPKLPEHL